jgi:hypothetical protein
MMRPTQNFSALEITIGVQLRTQFKVAFQKGFRILKNLQNIIVSHVNHLSINKKVN